MWHGDVTDVEFAKDTSISGETCDSGAHNQTSASARIKLRRLLANNKSFDCPEFPIRGAVPPPKFLTRKSAPRRRGQAVVLDIDDAGVTAKIPGRIFEVARYCFRKHVDPASERLDGSEATQLIRVGLMAGARQDMAP